MLKKFAKRTRKDTLKRGMKFSLDGPRVPMKNVKLVDFVMQNGARLIEKDAESCKECRISGMLKLEERSCAPIDSDSQIDSGGA